MSEIKWIKLATDIFDDEKILLIESMPDADAIIVVWFKLLCLAGKQNNDGFLTINDRIPYTDEMLAAIFRRNVNTVRLALQTFENFGMIEIINGVITIPNWKKHQSLVNKNEYMKKYMREYRKNTKVLTDVNSNVNLTLTDKNKEQKNKEERIEEYVHCTGADVPTIDDVGSFAKVNGIPAEISERFFYHYNKSGWMANNGQPVQNWKGLLMSWMKASSGKSDEMDPIIAQVVQSTARS